jgi:hypothetical protein
MEAVAGVCLSFGSTVPTTIMITGSVGRVASTVLSVKAPAHKYMSAPQSATVTPLVCEQLGTLQSPIFHEGWLLPQHCNKCTMALALGLFSPKENWAQRNLTVDKVFIAKDCGRVVIDLLGSGSLTNAFL